MNKNIIISDSMRQAYFFANWSHLCKKKSRKEKENEIITNFKENCEFLPAYIKSKKLIFEKTVEPVLRGWVTA